VLGTISVSGLGSAFAVADNDKSDQHDSKDSASHDSKDERSNGNNNDNGVEQSISQPQTSEQIAECLTGVTSALNCNNVAFQLGLNTGNLAAGEQ
jgi:hypothetical protein